MSELSGICNQLENTMQNIIYCRTYSFWIITSCAYPTV